MKERLVLKKNVKKFLWIMIIILIGLISIKKHPEYKTTIIKNIYEKSYSMIEPRLLYKKYFTWMSKENTKRVNTELLKIESQEKTNEGVLLTVKEKTPIPTLESGVIVYTDDNKTIIEQIDGVVATYQNIVLNQYKLYDYLEKGEILGEPKSNTIILSFVKSGDYYDYKNYL